MPPRTLPPDPRSLPRRPVTAVLAAVLAVTGPTLAACSPFDAGTEEPNEVSAPSTATEIIDRYVTALGGEEKLRRLRQRTMEAELLFKAEPGCDANDPNCIPEDTSGQFMLYLTADGRMFRSTVVGDQILQHGFDGEEGWQYQVDPPFLVVEDASQQASTREDAILHWYLDLAARDIVPVLQETRRDEQSGKQLDGIAWVSTRAKLPQRVLWFDRATGLLDEETEKDEASGAIERRHFSDYREVDGVLVPHSIHQVQAVDGHMQEVDIKVHSVHHREIPTAKFAMPTPPKIDASPDEILGYLDAARATAKSSPDDPAAILGWARVAFAAAHFEEAANAARKAHELSPKDPEALWILAQTQILGGELAAARKNLDRAAKLGLHRGQYARQRAWIELRSGHWAAGGKLLAEAAQRSTPPPSSEEPSSAEILAASLKALGERFTAFSGPPLSLAAGGPCTVSLPMHVDDDALVVELVADGEPLRLLVDTAAPDLILADAVAKKMIVGTDAEAPLIVGGRFYGRGQVDELELGPWRVKNVPATLFSDADMAQTTGDPTIQGVIGLRVFADMQVTLDVEGKTLTLVRTSAKCKPELARHREGLAIPFWYHEFHHIYVLAQMNGAEGLYLVNSGMRGADLTAHELAYARAAIGAPTIRQGEVPMVEVATFAVGDHVAKDLRAAFGFITQTGTADGFRLDGMIGLGALPGGGLTIDLAQHKLYLRAAKANTTPVSPAKPPPSAGRPG